MNKTKRILALILALIMAFSAAPTTVFAVVAGSWTRDSFTLTSESVEVNGTDSAEATVVFKNNVDISYFSATNGTFSLNAYSDAECTIPVSGITLTSMEPASSFNLTIMDNNTVGENGGNFAFTDSNYSNINAGTALWSATYTVDGTMAEGTYYVKLYPVSISDMLGSSLSNESYSATITISEPAAPAADYEIYYTLDSTTDEIGADGTSGSDNYMEYDVSTDAGKIVTATVLLKNNTDAAITLQAYDIYLDYHEGLKYMSHAMTGAAALIEGSNVDQADTAGAAVTHIEAVSDSYVKNVDAADRTVGANDELELGTITFTIDSANENVKYGTDLHITLTDAEDTENSNKDEKVTNFSVGSDATGDKTSYYPMDISEISGAEVNNTYIIQFASAIAGATLPDNVVKQHNVPVTLGSASLDGYEFLGWTTDDTPDLGDTPDYEAGNSYTANVSDTLYAVWDVATADYTVKHMQQNIAGTGYVEVEADRQTLSGQTGAATNAVAKSYEGFAAQTITQGTIAADGSTVVEIFYDRISYTITFDTDGGTDIPAITAKYGATVTAPSDPSKTGYTFAKWDQEIPTTMPAGNLTITAEWTPITYTVVYEANTGAGTTASSTHNYDEAKALTANAFTKTGYTFAGWNTLANGEGTSYENEAEVTNLASVQDAEFKLYAQWTPNTYTVKFNPGTYGTGEMVDQILTYDKSESLNDNAFTSTDTSYAFAGWATSVNGDVVYKNKESVTNLAESGEFNLYAVWKQNTISYVADPTGVQMTLTDLPVTYTIGEAFEITAKPTATGYTFNGWSCEAYSIDTVGNPEKSITIPATATGNVELTAHWTVNEYTLTFAETGDSVIEDITQYYGTDVTKPEDPTKTGYSFIGWDVDGNGDADANDVFPATMPATDAADKTITITAIWKINQYTITFDAAGGTPTPDAITQDYNTAVDTTGVQAPSKTGYTFNGWSPAIPTVMPAGDTTVVAQWTENNYTIKFETGNFGTIDDIEASYTEEVTLPDGTDLSNPGYEVKGWTTTPNPEIDDEVEYEAGATKSGLTDADDGTVILYPVWKYATYELTFDLGAHAADNHEAIDSVDVVYNSTYPELPTANPAPGYKFVGWFIDVDDETTQIVKDGEVTITADTKLTAKYEAIKYTITFNANGGAVDPASTTYTYEKAATLPTPTNGLYKFVGWKLETKTGNWEAATYNAGDYTEKYGVEGESMELVAQWEIPFTYAIEDYKYAYTDYVMLRIATDSNTNAYSFDDETMYYTEDANYKLTITQEDGTSEQKNVFVTLIPSSYVDNGVLNDAGMKMIAQTTGAVATEIDRDGDVNGDGVLNIADANIVYQMVEQQSKGGYYPVDKLDTLARLEADMDTTVDSTTDDHRGSIEDVNAIVNIINGVTATTN